MRKTIAATAGTMTLAVGMLVAAACGSSGSSAKSSDTSPTSGGKSNAPVKLSGSVTNKGTKDLTAQGMSAKLEIEADDDYFSPTFIKTVPGATVTVELKNEGKQAHTFTIDGTSIDQQLSPGETKSVTVTVPTSGDAEFHCRFHQSLGMQGAFFTTAASSSSASSSTPSSAPTPASQSSSTGY